MAVGIDHLKCLASTLAERIPNPMLRDAQQWAEEHIELLGFAYEQFDRSEEWPTLEHLQHRLEASGRYVDVHAVLGRTPLSICSIELQRLVVLVRGLAYVEAADGLVADWAAAIALAYRLWLADPEASLTRSQVLDLLDGDPQRTRRVAVLFERESWLFNGGQGGPDDEWSRQIHSRVRIARNAGGAAELIAALDADQFPALELGETIYSGPIIGPEGRVAGAAPTPHRSRTRQLWALVSENALISGLIVLVVGLLLGYFVFRPNSDGEGRTPFGEQAGAAGARTFAGAGLSREGPHVGANQQVEVACRTYAPAPPSVVPDGWWYRISSPPWSGRFYAPANSFWNGDIAGQMPYTHNTDFSVEIC